MEGKEEKRRVGEERIGTKRRGEKMGRMRTEDGRGEYRRGGEGEIDQIEGKGDWKGKRAEERV